MGRHRRRRSAGRAHQRSGRLWHADLLPAPAVAGISAARRQHQQQHRPGSGLAGSRDAVSGHSAPRPRVHPEDGAADGDRFPRRRVAAHRLAEFGVRRRGADPHRGSAGGCGPAADHSAPDEPAARGHHRCLGGHADAAEAGAAAHHRAAAARRIRRVLRRSAGHSPAGGLRVGPRPAVRRGQRFQVPVVRAGECGLRHPLHHRRLAVHRLAGGHLHRGRLRDRRHPRRAGPRRSCRRASTGRSSSSSAWPPSGSPSPASLSGQTRSWCFASFL